MDTLDRVPRRSEIPVGTRVRLRYTGKGNVPLWLAGTWATVKGHCRVRIEVSCDQEEPGLVRSVSIDNLQVQR